MLRGAPDLASQDEAAAAFGLRIVRDVQPELVEVFPDNELALHVFGHMTTQWAYSWRGKEGLRYEALPTVLDLLRVPADQRDADLLYAVGVIEDEVLKRIEERRGQRGH